MPIKMILSFSLFVLVASTLAAPCIHEGVTVGRLEQGPECDTIIAGSHIIRYPGMGGGPCGGTLSCLQYSVHSNAAKIAKANAHARLTCTLLPGFDVNLSGWTRERCDEARSYIELCLKYDLTLVACLGDAIAQREMKPEWLEAENNRRESFVFIVNPGLY